jgi:hypothetical protein
MPISIILGYSLAILTSATLVWFFYKLTQDKHQHH